MELFIYIAAFLALCLPAVLSAKKLRELKSETRELEKMLREKESASLDADIAGDFEEAYRKGLAGIMAYSLSQAAGEDEA